MDLELSVSRHVGQIMENVESRVIHSPQNIRFVFSKQSNHFLVVSHQSIHQRKLFHLLPDSTAIVSNAGECMDDVEDWSQQDENNHQSCKDETVQNDVHESWYVDPVSWITSKFFQLELVRVAAYYSG